MLIHGDFLSKHCSYNFTFISFNLTKVWLRTYEHTHDVDEFYSEKLHSAGGIGQLASICSLLPKCLSGVLLSTRDENTWSSIKRQQSSVILFSERELAPP